jgi:hypothetical protein
MRRAGMSPIGRAKTPFAGVMSDVIPAMKPLVIRVPTLVSHFGAIDAVIGMYSCMTATMTTGITHYGFNPLLIAICVQPMYDDGDYIDRSMFQSAPNRGLHTTSQFIKDADSYSLFQSPLRGLRTNRRTAISTSIVSRFNPLLIAVCVQPLNKYCMSSPPKVSIRS